MCRVNTQHGDASTAGKFLHAKSPDGSSKKLIELLPVTDLDGLSDRVWHFR